MTSKERKFMEVYLRTRDARQAARAAGYMASDNASAILRQKSIREAIAAASERGGK